MHVARYFSTRLDPVATTSLQIDRSGVIETILAPVGWTTARIEAWLDWAAVLPSDLPFGTDIALSAADPGLLSGGPASYARRQASWGSGPRTVHG